MEKPKFNFDDKVFVMRIRPMSPYEFDSGGIPELEKCKSDQKIKVWVTGELGQLKDGVREQIFRVHAIVDGKRIDNTIELIQNDGFDNVIQFANWFKKPFEGKILHWSDLRY